MSDQLQIASAAFIVMCELAKKREKKMFVKDDGGCHKCIEITKIEAPT